MLAEALAEYKVNNLSRSKRCGVGNWGETLTPEDNVQFKEALLDKEFSTRDLYTIFNKVGAPYSMETLRRHRNGECSCQN